MKTCARCSESKPVSAFSRGPRYRDGYQPWCKACMRAYRVERYAQPGVREAERQRKRDRYHTDAEFRERKRAQVNARRRRGV